MSSDSSLQDVARDLFDRECERLRQEVQATARGEKATLDFQPAYCVLTEMLNLGPLRSQAHQHLEPIVRQRLLDEAFIDQAGDSVIDSRYHLQLEKEVELILSVFEQIHQRVGEASAV